MKVMISVGTHEQPFQRLLDAVAAVVPERPDDEWTVQYGVGVWSIRTDRVHAEPYLDADAMRRALLAADVLVSQASPGNVFGALAAGTWPIVLGRTRARGEHVDDHQVRFARALAELGRATDLGDADRLAHVLATEAECSSADRAARIARAARAARANELAFRRDVWGVLGVPA